jgi:hypothetical protein
LPFSFTTKREERVSKASLISDWERVNVCTQHLGWNEWRPAEWRASWKVNPTASFPLLSRDGCSTFVAAKMPLWYFST